MKSDRMVENQAGAVSALPVNEGEGSEPPLDIAYAIAHTSFITPAGKGIVCLSKDATIRLPFGAGRTSPIDSRDVAEVIAAILANPASHIGKACRQSL